MSYLPTTKWGVCSTCGGSEQEVVKVKKDLFCLACRNAQKTEEQIQKSKRRIAARNAGFKLRNLDMAGRGTEEYFEAERQAIINDLDFVFSRIVRRGAADSVGNCSCYTCGKINHWTVMQCGHYEKRGNTQIRWDLRNAKVQCKYCNEDLGGNLEIYTKKLEEEHKGLPDQLKEMAREPYKWTRDELKMLLVDLRAKLKTIENKATNIT